MRVQRRRALPQRGGAALAVLFAVAAHVSGCGYHLAGGNAALPPDIKRIAIPVFVNRSSQPDVAQRLTERVVDEFVRRGGYVAAASPDSADAVLNGIVMLYRETPVAINVDGRATRYVIEIQVDAELVDMRDDSVLWKDDHFVFRQQYEVDTPETPFFDRRIIAIELVSEDFARSVVATILEGF